MKRCKDCFFENMRWYKGVDWCVVRFMGRVNADKCPGYIRLWWKFWRPK